MTGPLPSIAELFEIIYRYYPRGIEDDHYSNPSIEWQRRSQAFERAMAERERLERLEERLRAEYPGASTTDETIRHSLGGAYVLSLCPAPYNREDLREYKTAVGMVSFLAPVYLVHASVIRQEPEGHRWTHQEVAFVAEGEFAELAPYMESLARGIEAEFGYCALPLEVGRLSVPDVQVGNLHLGQACLMDCLFTDDRR